MCTILSAEFTVISSRERSDYRDLIWPVSQAVWPEFMHHDVVASEHWDALFEAFPDYQFALLSRDDDVVAGMANSAPLTWAANVRDLPDEGWDWALAKSISDHAEGVKPKVLCGLQISIAPGFQRRGLSRILLNDMVECARSAGLFAVIVPVRPIMKHRYPLTSMEAYIRWTVDDGLPYDPWLRAHVRHGGRIVKPCPLSMRVVGTVSEWEEWTGLKFFESGAYVVPGALVPVHMDVEDGVGVYIEPNVWVVHEVEWADE